MSIRNAMNFTAYVNYDERPDWMKCERYDYCEQFDELKERTGWFEKVVSLFR
ncbi:MAG: hypothetical protein IJ137_00120 [Eubacterium sp.]|nr:hypothetical protein [Eubacterium sp.]